MYLLTSRSLGFRSGKGSLQFVRPQGAKMTWNKYNSNRTPQLTWGGCLIFSFFPWGLTSTIFHALDVPYHTNTPGVETETESMKGFGKRELINLGKNSLFRLAPASQCVLVANAPFFLLGSLILKIKKTSRWWRRLLGRGTTFNPTYCL